MKSLIIFCALVSTLPSAFAAERPNIVFLLTDDQTSSTLGCYGHPTTDLIDFDDQGRTLEGVLAMQVHVGPAMKVQFKDFKIKHLPDDLPLLKPADHPIPTGSLGVKPQDKLPLDWIAPVYGKP